MEDLVRIDPRSGKPTNFGAAFREICDFLGNMEIPHIFVGTLALNIYIRPRYTEEIQVICEYSAIGQLGNELSRLAEQAGFGGSIRAEAPANPAMANALASTRPVELFDTTFHVPTALALCWLFLESDDLYSLVDAGSLLAAEALDGDLLQPLLEHYASHATLIRFGEAKRNVEQGRYSGTYNDSVRARLLRHQQKDADAN